MSEGKIIARRREDRPEVLYLVISNPKALNALTEEMQIDLIEKLRAARDDKSVRCVVLRGEGDRAFSSGGEVQSLMAGDRPLYLAVAEQMARRGASLVVGSGYSLDIRDVRRLCPKSFLLLPECDGENAVPAFDEYGHGAMTVDFDLQFAPDAAAAVDSAVREMKQWVTVV